MFAAAPATIGRDIRRPGRRLRQDLPAGGGHGRPAARSAPVDAQKEGHANLLGRRIPKKYHLERGIFKASRNGG
jgi:hypothetical protein